jgi:antibiotic biosynthesis monooxygenase (ABM) superfamily enzyme
MSFQPARPAIEHPEPVTVIFTHFVKLGCEVAYEQWVQGISQAARQFDGHLGISILRPSPGVRHEYVSILKFDRYDNLKAWVESSARQEWIGKAASLVDDLKVEMITGMEAWFTLPSQSPIKPPPRYKMAILSWVAVYALLSLLGFSLAPLLAALPAFIRTFIIQSLWCC